MRRAAVVLLVVAGVEIAGGGRAAVAEDAAMQAQYHFKRGQVFFDDGDFQSAIGEFDQAFAIVPNVEYLPQIAKTHEEMGNFKRAIDAYKAYLTKGEKTLGAAERKQATDEIARLEQRLKSSENAQAAIGHFETGKAESARGNYELAAVEFDQAYELTRDPAYLLHLARVQAAGGDKEAALERYKRFLDEGGESLSVEDRAAAEREMARLKAPANQELADIEAREHYANGWTQMGKGALAAAKGEFQKAYELSGDAGYLYYVGLAAERVGDVGGAVEAYKGFLAGGAADGQKRADAEGAIRRLGAMQGKQAASGSTAAPVPGPTQPAGAPESGPKRPWTWVCFGIGAAAGVGAVVTGALVLKKEKDLRNHCPGGVCQPAASDEIDTVEMLGPLTDVLIGVAAAGAVAGVIAYFVEGKRESNAAVALAPTNGGGAILVSGRF